MARNFKHQITVYLLNFTSFYYFLTQVINHGETVSYFFHYSQTKISLDMNLYQPRAGQIILKLTCPGQVAQPKLTCQKNYRYFHIHVCSLCHNTKPYFCTALKPGFYNREHKYLNIFIILLSQGVQ
jgi:hypothetical protein